MPNQPIAPLKNKKNVLIIGIISLVAVVIVCVLALKGCQKKKPAQALQETKPAVAQTQIQKETTPQPEAAQASAQTEKIQTEPAVSAPKATTGQNDTSASVQPSSKKSFKWAKKKRVRDVATLIAMLKKALDKSDEKQLNLSLKSLTAEGEDVVGLLKEEILSNVSRPDIRRNALWGLFYTDDQDAIPILKTILKVDPDESVRYVALFVLYSMLKDSADFIEEVSRTDVSEKIRLKAQEYYQLKSINQ